VFWIRTADKLNTRFTNYLYYKFIAITDGVLKYILEHSMTLFCKVIIIIILILIIQRRLVSCKAP